MKTLIITSDINMFKKISNELDIIRSDVEYINENIATKDIIFRLQGRQFDRVLFTGKKPEGMMLAYLSIYTRDGAIFTNYNNYKLTKILKQL